MTRLEILTQSLKKKEAEFDEKISSHFAKAAEANGQPLNDKRNGQATLNMWERQNNSLRSLNEGIEKTKAAIKKEQDKADGIEHVNNFIPAEILSLVESGELAQWGKHPHVFFVAGVDKARIIWDVKKKIVAHKYSNTITDLAQRKKFAAMFNRLHNLFN